jgi:hAT family C-terminal dimerisation region
MYPTLWKVARDILPVQASSVSCERIFSSAKLTTTVQRNQMSPKLVEMLQILKFGLKQDALTFTGDWVLTSEEIHAEEHLDDY